MAEQLEIVAFALCGAEKRLVRHQDGACEVVRERHAAQGTGLIDWRKHLDEATIARQAELGAMGYRFQFVTLAGFRALNHGMFELAQAYAADGMRAYAQLQDAEFKSERSGYTATRHQREVGTGYFDLVAETLSAGQASTLALAHSTEAEQF